MKIVFTTDSISRGGKERQMFILTHHLLKKNYDVYILSLKNSQVTYIEEYEIPQERVLIIGGTSKLEKFNSFKIKLTKIKPDIVFSWEAQTALFSLILRRRLKYIVINASVQHGIRLNKKSHYLRSLILWFSQYRLGNSKAGLRANNLDINCERNIVLYNGIESIFSLKDEGEELESNRNILIPNFKKGRKVFITVANFVPFKDYSTLFLALSEFRKEGNDFYLIVLGDGPMRSVIEMQINELDLYDNVIIKGRVDNVNDFLRISDIYLHSSKGEGVSNAILEAMYCGLPVISSNVGGVPETICPNYGSLLFTYKDTDQLFNNLVNSEVEFESFNPKSETFQNHLSKFKVENMVMSFEEIVKEIIKK